MFCSTVVDVGEGTFHGLNPSVRIERTTRLRIFLGISGPIFDNLPSTLNGGQRIQAVIRGTVANANKKEGNYAQ
jgi:hypothetical protein